MTVEDVLFASFEEPEVIKAVWDAVGLPPMNNLQIVQAVCVLSMVKGSIDRLREYVEGKRPFSVELISNASDVVRSFLARRSDD